MDSLIEILSVSIFHSCRLPGIFPAFLSEPIFYSFGMDSIHTRSDVIKLFESANATIHEDTADICEWTVESWGWSIVLEAASRFQCSLQDLESYIEVYVYNKHKSGDFDYKHIKCLIDDIEVEWLLVYITGRRKFKKQTALLEEINVQVRLWHLRQLL